MSSIASPRNRVHDLTDFAERYLLSTFYLWLAFRAVQGVVDRIYLRPEAAAEQGWWLVSVIRELNVFGISLLIGLLLWRSRPPVERPREWREFVVPLAVSTFFVVYSFQLWLPEPLRRSLAPLSVQVPCALASLLLGTAGSLLALCGVIALGRSFGIFVAVRKVVLVGPYRYVRHPIYSGYLLIWLGMILANLSVAVVVLVTIHTLLMVYRARLEERRLAEASPEYRAYREQTGFLFPRLRPAAGS